MAQSERRGPGQRSQSEPQAQPRSATGQASEMQRAGQQQQGIQRGGMMGARTPFAFVRRMMDDMDRLFGEFGMGGMTRGLSSLFEEEPVWSGGMMQTFSPELEVFERDGKLVVRADLPGLTRDDVRVNVEQNALVIEGERRTEEEKTEGGVFHSERSYGSFRRVVALPRGAKIDSCDARFDNGVLEITMDLPEESRRRRIEIRAGEGEKPAEQPRGGAQAQPPQPQENGPGAPSTRH